MRRGADRTTTQVTSRWTRWRRNGPASWWRVGDGGKVGAQAGGGRGGYVPRGSPGAAPTHQPARSIPARASRRIRGLRRDRSRFRSRCRTDAWRMHELSRPVRRHQRRRTTPVRDTLRHRRGTLGGLYRAAARRFKNGLADTRARARTDEPSDSSRREANRERRYQAGLLH
jgi:hypothetical protein